MNKNRLEIRLFGGLDLRLGGDVVGSLPTRKAEALLTYLACQKRPIGREVLADLLWDDRSQDQALANLRSILSSLRKVLKDHLLVTRQTVAFDRSSDHWLDVDAFTQQIDALARLPGDQRTAALQAAVDLYRGDFLEGFYLRESIGFEEWAILERERLQRLAVDLFWQGIEATSVAGD
ncbi:MAG: hypothetical protein KDD84_09535, partial [Caldilineaceae bacterium]|nr:hypothetical protein [Caldilineaceae bacterium]